ncbi:hypothetical protein AAFF_G00265680 [Aldrovandia affinis]|uniref:Uncharacterized protein n=1 Tax=Aldrovandia affinis TaxID=143900 RepID=A0AAD7RC21_9TELE|nr:hypothetical protein AAFF_G00265680 [Aldrovandia affinis]
MKFNTEAPIWSSKQHILCTLNQSLKDVLNYGLFQPAYNGKAGKFLDEERLLKDYPLPAIAPIPYLEFRYKRRVYTETYVDDKQLAKLHTKGGIFLSTRAAEAMESLSCCGSVSKQNEAFCNKVTHHGPASPELHLRTAFRKPISPPHETLTNKSKPRRRGKEPSRTRLYVFHQRSRSTPLRTGVVCAGPSVLLQRCWENDSRTGIGPIVLPVNMTVRTPSPLRCSVHFLQEEYGLICLRVTQAQLHVSSPHHSARQLFPVTDRGSCTWALQPQMAQPMQNPAFPFPCD